MLIDDLAGRNVRMSARSLTAVGDDGKACGVVRNSVPLASLPPRDEFTFSTPAVRAWRSKYSASIRPGCLRIVSGRLYYLRDMGWEQRSRAAGLTEAADRMEQAAREAGAIATVIPVRVVR